MTKIILALDLGATTGWAIVSNGVQLYGEEHFRGLRPERFVAFHAWLDDLMNDRLFDYVIFERPFSRGLHTTRSLWGMAGIVELLAEKHGHPCLDIVPSTLKKWATGNGRACKKDMMHAAHYKIIAYHRHIDDAPLREHEADAIILGLYAAENIEPGE